MSKEKQPQRLITLMMTDVWDGPSAARMKDMSQLLYREIEKPTKGRVVADSKLFPSHPKLQEINQMFKDATKDMKSRNKYPYTMQFRVITQLEDKYTEETFRHIKDVMFKEKVILFLHNEDEEITPDHIQDAIKTFNRYHKDAIVPKTPEDELEEYRSRQAYFRSIGQ